MKKLILLHTFVFSIAVTAFSQTYNYAPNQLNIPCLQQKGDLVLGLGWGRGLVFQALEVQGTYSPLPNLAIMANYFRPHEKDIRNKEKVGTDFYLWEAALGVYEKMPRGSASLFAGYGSGNLFSSYGQERIASFDLQRIFIQPGLNYRSHFFQAALALRISRLAFNNGLVSFSIDAPDIQYIQNIEKSSPFFLPELGLQIGMRFAPVVISLNITTIFPDTEKWNFNRLNSGLGIVLNFGKRQKKTAPQLPAED